MLHIKGYYNTTGNNTLNCNFYSIYDLLGINLLNYVISLLYVILDFNCSEICKPTNSCIFFIFTCNLFGKSVKFKIN